MSIKSIKKLVAEKKELNRKERQILNILKKEERIVASKIAALVGLPMAYARKYLENLESMKKVKKFEETNATYWEILK